MASTVWRGHLAFGLVSFPVRLFRAARAEKVSFRFFGSSVRREDRAGTELDHWKEGELEELAPIEVTLPAEGRRTRGDIGSVARSSGGDQAGRRASRPRTPARH